MDIGSEDGVVSFGVGQGREGYCATPVLVQFFEFGGVGFHFPIEHSGLVALHPAQTPAGGYYVRYEIDFHLVGGLKEVEIGLPYFHKKILVLVLEDKGFGGEPVAEGVH